ncbi:MAG: hypothetical protein HZC55_02840 [Verrucomicrobia bacterium]|nr:hypothetical protein [Verrucomicrobiota bacterium]
MLRRSLIGLLLLISVNAVRADGGWAQLKLGMSESEVVAALGRPLICSKGRGFARWTYDRGAEVLLHGSLIGWTAPGPANVVNRSTDIWQAANGDSSPREIAQRTTPTLRRPAAGAGRATSEVIVVRPILLPQRAPSRW